MPRLKKRHISMSTVAFFLLSASGGIWFLLRAPDPTAYPWPLLEDRRLEPHELNPKYEQKIAQQFDEFEYLVEEALTLRARTLSFADDLKRQIKSGNPITGEQSEIINIGIQMHLDVRERFMHFVDRFKGWIDSDYDRRLSRSVRIKGLMLGLSAALTLYDNYALAILVFEQNPDLRRIMNQQDRGYKVRTGELLRVTASYLSPRQRALVDKVAKFLIQDKDNREWISEESKDDPRVAWLWSLIEQSPSFQTFREEGPFRHFAQIVGFFSRHTSDSVQSAQRIALGELSKNFGNAVGLIQTRSGKLFKKDDIKRAIAESLEPLDVLLEKTPFRLTDKLIPGHYGHVAIWVGTKSDLMTRGLWDHPTIQPIQAEIESGKSVVEALREGVVLSSLDKFLNVDDLAVLRPQGVSLTDNETILRAVRQLGKLYDFNFDVETRDRIVCSELAYVTFTGIDWPTENKLGRSTISPDNVANMAFDEGSFVLRSLYHDGRRIGGNRLRAFRRLLAGKRPI